MLAEIFTYCDFQKDGIVIPPESGLNIMQVYTFLHEAIADNHLPVVKAVGFKIHDVSSVRTRASVTERNTAVMENYVEIAGNLMDKVFLDTNTNKVIVLDLNGKLNLNNPDTVVQENRNPVRVVYDDPYILGALRTINLEIFINENTGHRDMGCNVRVLRDQTFFPLFSVHTVYPYCRICPPRAGEKLEYRLRKGFKPEDLKKLLGRLITMRNTGELEGSDATWLSNYER